MRLTKKLMAAGIRSIEYHDRNMDSYICQVDLDKIVVDRAAYQRGHDTKHSDRMMAKQLAVWPYPICSFRNGVLNATDGQHRIESAKKREQKAMNVVVKFGLTTAEEAGLYAELNTQKRPNPWNQFHARLTEGAPDYVDMRNVAANAGFTLKCDNARADLRNTHPMIEAYRVGLYRAWIDVLKVFKNDDGRLNKSVATSAIEFQRGIIDVLRHYGTVITSKKSLSALRQIGPSLIVQRASDKCDCGRTNRSHYMEAIEECLMNRGILRRATKLLAA